MAASAAAQLANSCRKVPAGPSGSWEVVVAAGGGTSEEVETDVVVVGQDAGTGVSKLRFPGACTCSMGEPDKPLLMFRLE